MLICSKDDVEGEQKIANATKAGAKAQRIVRLAGWVGLSFNVKHFKKLLMYYEQSL